MIKNYREVIDSSIDEKEKKAKKLVLKAINNALKKSQADRIVKDRVKVDGAKLYIMNNVFNLDKFERVIVVGAGKASGAMAKALEDMLNDRIFEGFVNVPEGTASRYKLEKIFLNEASHPKPNQKGVDGAKRIVEIVSNAKEKDLVICLISGGGSALLPLPVDDVALGAKGLVSIELMRRGATINELNTVRKHLSQIKGGWLAKHAYPATLITLIMSDVVGDRLDVIASGPTSPDTTTFKDAIKVLKKYSLWDEVDESIKRRFVKGQRGEIPETPKEDDICFTKTYNFILANNRYACKVVEETLKGEGVKTVFLSSCVEGEARHIGVFLSSLIQERKDAKESIAFICGGETVVTVKGRGKGGRNQELALASIFKIKGIEGGVIAAIGTDGIDGMSDAAGAIATWNTYDKAAKIGMNPIEYLEDNDSGTFFSKLKDAMVTGPTGTNLNDVYLALLLRSS
jgi:glycerate-2-kinase